MAPMKSEYPENIRRIVGVRPADKLGHRTRFSDASSYDFVCQTCGSTDAGSDLRKKCASPMNDHDFATKRILGFLRESHNFSLYNQINRDRDAFVERLVGQESKALLTSVLDIMLVYQCAHKRGLIGEVKPPSTKRRAQKEEPAPSAPLNKSDAEEGLATWHAIQSAVSKKLSAEAGVAALAKALGIPGDKAIKLRAAYDEVAATRSMQKWDDLSRDTQTTYLLAAAAGVVWGS
jgi:hypothetical protein